MGSCISKCKPKTIKKQQQPRFDFNNLIQDKLIVIPAQTTTTTTTTNPILSLNNKISPYPPSPNSSISTTTTTPNNSSSTSTPRRSLTFSDEYLWPSYKQNPHVALVNSLKATAFLPPGVKPVSPVVRYSSPQRVLRPTPQKRVRPTSPLPIRQKSFKKERSGLSIPEKTVDKSWL